MRDLPFAFKVADTVAVVVVKLEAETAALLKVTPEIVLAPLRDAPDPTSDVNPIRLPASNELSVLRWPEMPPVLYRFTSSAAPNLTAPLSF